MNTKNDILRLEQEFKDCQKALIAIGDETRQHILMMMLEGECTGQERRRDMIRIHIFRCGATVVDEALPLANKSKNPFAYTGIARGKKLGYEPKDIDYCILTHMDIDHAGELHRNSCYS